MDSTPAAAPVTSTSDPVDLSWVIRSRWGLVIAFLVALILSELGAVQQQEVAPMVAGAAITTVTNLLHRWPLRFLSMRAMTMLILAFDTVVLTAVLYSTGGAANPLTALFLMPIALAAVLLPARFAWLLALVTMLMFFLLFLSPESHNHQAAMHATPATGEPAHHGMGGHEHDEHHEHHAMVVAPTMEPRNVFDLHLRGMWMAFAITAILVVYFVTRVSAALRARESQLEEARARTYRAERVASLASLAASTAHELGTPLASIALSASEMRRALAAGQAGPSVSEDVEIVCAEVKRCREIIDAMLGAAGETVGEAPVEVTASELLDEAVKGLPRAEGQRVERGPDLTISLHMPRRIVAQALQNLLRNALEASPPQGLVQLRTDARADRIRFVVTDQGAGMDAQALRRAFEPFVTTKPGRGRGMGLFFVSSVAHRLGGELTLVSEPERGTEASLELPVTSIHVGPTAGSPALRDDSPQPDDAART